jgi:hypothetical protein
MPEDEDLSFEEDRKFREITEASFRQKSTVSKLCGEAIIIAFTGVLVAGACWLIGTIVSNIPH